jgi:type II secretory pathway pseudopilin PulG
MTPPRKRRRSGFTLLELLIVGTLGTLVMVSITNAWIWYARTSNTMHVDAQLNRELKLAAAAIAQDYGPALAARTTDGSSLQLDYDNNSDSTAQWSAPDGLVEYSLTDGKLVRHDDSAGTDVPMANNITAIAADVVDGHLNVKLTATYRTTTQELTLQLRDPS